jgi:hypothetical protein
MTDEMNSNDPLRQLLVDAAQVDRERIAGVLKDRVLIDSTSGSLVLLPEYRRFNAYRKILAVLLARKAAVLLDLADTDALTNKQVTELTRLRPGTAAPGVRDLREMHLLDQNSNKAYFIPNSHISAVIEFIEEAD